MSEWRRWSPVDVERHLRDCLNTLTRKMVDLEQLEKEASDAEVEYKVAVAKAQLTSERKSVEDRKADAIVKCEPPWWLGKKGRLSDSGISQMIARRCEAVGLPRLHPHQFRHTFAHQWLSSGGAETELMTLTGWRSREMLGRYGASAASERAHNAHRRLSPNDRLG